jgi:hypothetical protein
MRRALVCGLMGLLALAPVAYAQSVPCLQWCKQCNAGRGVLPTAFFKSSPCAMKVAPLKPKGEKPRVCRAMTGARNANRTMRLVPTDASIKENP